MAFGGSLAKPTRSLASIPAKRAALFVDGANAWATAKSLSAAFNITFEMDWDKILTYFNGHYDLIGAYYYTAVPDGDAPIRPLVDHLSYNGYNVKTKPMKEFLDPSTGRMKKKGNMDLEMALDAYDLARESDITDVILFTGDGDFRVLTERIQRLGCRVHVVSTTETQPPMIADELRRQVDRFIDLKDMINEFKRG